MELVGTILTNTETKTKKGRGIVHLATQNNANEQSGAVTRLGHQPL